MSISLRRDGAGPGPIVTRIEDGGFRTQEHYFADGVVLTPVSAQAWAGSEDAADLDEAAIADVLALFGEDDPEFLLLGTGTEQVFPSPALRRAMDERDIAIEAMDSRAAARAWAVLRAEDRRIVALLLPLR